MNQRGHVPIIGKCAVRALVVLLLSAVASAVWAGSVLVIHGPTLPVDLIVSALKAAGHDVHTVSSGEPFPSSLDAYDQVWDVRLTGTTDLIPQTVITESQRAQYIAYLASGKKMFVAGDYSAAGQRNDSIVSLIIQGGGGIVNHMDAHDATGFANQTVLAPFNGPRPVTTVRFAGAGGFAHPGSGKFMMLMTVSGLPPGVGIVYAPGSLRNAPAGTLIVMFDLNFTTSEWQTANEAALLHNIIHYLSPRSGPTLATVVDGLRYPQGVAVHNGVLYIADRSGHTVWKMVLATGEISPLAGTGVVQVVNGVRTLVPGKQGYNGDGILATQAQLNGPAGVAVAANGDVFVTDSGNHIVRKINTGGMITTVAGTPKTLPPVVNGVLSLGNGGPATLAFLNGPRGITIDLLGNIFVADTMNQQVRKVDASGVISAVAGLAGITGNNDGTVVEARLNDPRGVAVDEAGNVYIADVGNNKIRKVSGTSVTSVAAGTLRAPAGIAVGGDGALFISDTGTNRVLRFRDASVTTEASELNVPIGLAIDTNGDVYVADQVGNRVLKIVSE